MLSKDKPTIPTIDLQLEQGRICFYRITLSWLALSYDADHATGLRHKVETHVTRSPIICTCFLAKGALLVIIVDTVLRNRRISSRLKIKVEAT